jgi:endonuclease/exonuclease/phosphatase (EEP) superfamily protein YafD
VSAPASPAQPWWRAARCRRWLAWLSVAPALAILLGAAAPWWPGQMCCHWSLHAALLLLPALMLFGRRPAVGLPLLGLIALGCAPWLAAALEPRAPAAARGGFVVATANIANWNADRLSAAGAATATEPAVLCLVEVGRDNQNRLREDPRWPHQLWRLSPLGIALLSAYPILSSEVHDARTSPVIEAVLDTPAGRARVIAAHATSPTSPERQRARARELGLVARLATQDDLPVLVLGDFNCSVGDPDWRAFRADAGLLRAAGREPATWPSYVGPFGVAIDHILARGLALDDERAVWLPGSDHRGLTARVAPRD